MVNTEDSMITHATISHISHMVVNKSIGWVETMPHGIPLCIVTIYYHPCKSWIAVIWGVFPSTAMLVLDVFAIAGDCVVIDSDQLYMKKLFIPSIPYSILSSWSTTLTNCQKIHIGPNLMHLYLLMGQNWQLHSVTAIVGFLRGGCSWGGGNWGTLRIPREDWGTLGNIMED